MLVLGKPCIRKPAIRRIRQNIFFTDISRSSRMSEVSALICCRLMDMFDDRFLYCDGKPDDTLRRA